MEPIVLYDTTLRDGTQGENINFTAEEKVKIALKLDDMGIHYIEGGWPGSNPRDKRFFELAKDIEFKNARLTAFGSTRKPGVSPDQDQNLKHDHIVENVAVKRVQPPEQRTLCRQEDLQAVAEEKSGNSKEQPFLKTS